MGKISNSAKPFLPILFAACLFTACSTSVNLQIERAPQISLTGVKTISIEPFSVTGELNLDILPSKRGGVVEVLTQSVANKQATKLARRKNVKFRSSLVQSLKNAVSANGQYQVTNTAKYDARISGTLYYEVNDQGSEKERVEKDSSVTRWYEYRRHAAVTLNFNVTDTKGVEMGSSQVSGVASDVAKGNNHHHAAAKSQDWDKVVHLAIQKSAHRLVKTIAPYHVWEKRTFEKGKSGFIKKGNKLAADGNWGGAVKLWEKGLNSGHKKDRAASLFNLGIYDEYNGELTEALAKYEEASTITGKSKMSKAVVRTQNRIAEMERLNAAEEGIVP